MIQVETFDFEYGIAILSGPNHQAFTRKSVQMKSNESNRRLFDVVIAQQYAIWSIVPEQREIEEHILISDNLYVQKALTKYIFDAFSHRKNHI